MTTIKDDLVKAHSSLSEVYTKLNEVEWLGLQIKDCLGIPFGLTKFDVVRLAKKLFEKHRCLFWQAKSHIETLEFRARDYQYHYERLYEEKTAVSHWASCLEEWEISYERNRKAAESSQDQVGR